jgi:hypothetical protein
MSLLECDLLLEVLAHGVLAHVCGLVETGYIMCNIKSYLPSRPSFLGGDGGDLPKRIGSWQGPPQLNLGEPKWGSRRVNWEVLSNWELVWEVRHRRLPKSKASAIASILTFASDITTVHAPDPLVATTSCKRQHCSTHNWETY